MVSFRLFAACVAAFYVVDAAAYATPRSLIPSLGGCLKALPKGQKAGVVSNVTITSGGVQRNYLISIPPTYNSLFPTPVILSYHGGVRTAEDQLLLDELTNPEFNKGYFVVYPQGIGNTWEGVPNITARNDIQFTADILNQVETLYCLDPSRVFATGKSDGAGFNNILACDPVLSKRFAAFAPVSGAYYINTLPCAPATVTIPCNNARKDIPFLTFHGGNDSTIAFLGGERKNECLPAISHFIQEWAARDGLSEKNVTTKLATNTVTYTFGSGLQAGLVELVFESDIGHDWPSTKPNADNQVAGHHVASYNATPIVIDFFERHPLSLLETLGEAL